MWIITVILYLYGSVLLLSVLKLTLEGIWTFSLCFTFIDSICWYVLWTNNTVHLLHQLFLSPIKLLFFILKKVWSRFPTAIFLFVVVFYCFQSFLQIFEYLFCLLVPFPTSLYSSVPICTIDTIEDCPIQVICNEEGFHIHVLFSRISLWEVFHLPFNFVQDILMSKSNVLRI